MRVVRLRMVISKITNRWPITKAAPKLVACFPNRFSCECMNAIRETTLEEVQGAPLSEDTMTVDEAQ